MGPSFHAGILQTTPCNKEKETYIMEFNAIMPLQPRINNNHSDVSKMSHYKCLLTAGHVTAMQLSSGILKQKTNLLELHYITTCTSSVEMSYYALILSR